MLNIVTGFFLSLCNFPCVTIPQFVHGDINGHFGCLWSRAITKHSGHVSWHMSIGDSETWRVLGLDSLHTVS